MALEERREPIFELDQKFRFLKENFFSRKCCGHTISENSFCKSLGIQRTTLLASVKAGGLTSKQQHLLAAKCQFSLSWPEWKDPYAGRTTGRDGRRDTFEAFEAKYLEHHSPKEPINDPPSTTLMALKDGLWADTPSYPPRMILVPLKEDLWADAPSYETELASLSLRTGQSQPEPGEVMLGFDLNCPEVVTDGLITGVKRGILTFDCGDGYTTEVSSRTGYVGGVDFNGAKFTPLSVDKIKPSWTVTALGGAPIGLVGDIPPTFIQFSNLSAGARVTADFVSCVKDIATTFMLPTDQSQSMAKQKIKKRLRELKLPASEEGKAKLAAAQIIFAARDE